MARARRNPIGLPLPGVQLVRLGSGEHSHIYDPATRHTLCRSAIGRAKSPQQLYKSDADQVTCYRCVKLAQMNLEAGRRADEVGKTSKAKKNPSKPDRSFLPWYSRDGKAWVVDLPDGSRISWFLNTYTQLQQVNIYYPQDELGRRGLHHLFEFKTAGEALDFADEWAAEHYPTWVLGLGQ